MQGSFGSSGTTAGLTVISAADAAKLDKKLLARICTIFDMRAATPIDLVSAMGAILPWYAVKFCLAQAGPHRGASFAKINWVYAWERQRNDHAARGVPLAHLGLAYHLMPSVTASGEFRRAIAFKFNLKFVEWQPDGRRACQC